jgi:hypothetical protein
MSFLFKVSTLSDPITSDSELLVARPGWAVMRVRPNFTENGQILWVDLLDALGHDLSFSARGRASDNADVLSFCWLAASHVDDLIIASANLLPPRPLRELCTMVSSLGVRTWLLYDLETCDEREEAEVSLMMSSVELQGFLEIRRAAGLQGSVERIVDSPLAPDTHFLGFLDTAREVLSEVDFALIATHFHFGRSEMLRRLEETPTITEDDLARLLHEITVGTNDLNKLTAIVKGAQAAAFAKGWHPRVDIARWAERGMVASLDRHLEPREWVQISRSYRPCDSAVSALSTMGISVDEMNQVLATNVAADGSEVHHGGQHLEVPLPARCILVAQLIFRNLVATSSDRFLVHGESEEEVSGKWSGRVLKMMTRDTGVVVRGSNASRKSMETTRWTHRFGVSVTRLTS